MELEIEIPELQILLNEMTGPVEIKYPPYDFAIASLRESSSGYILTGMCTRDDFEEAIEPFGEFAYDMPHYADVVQSMLAAGILNYRNAFEFKSLMDHFRAISRDVQFSLDTNMLYDGFPSHAGINPALYLLVDVVQSEIESALNTKYSPQAIADLRRMAPFEKEVFHELLNQKMKRSRIAAYGALAEFQKIRNRARIVEGIEPAGADSGRNDLVIVRSLKAFEKRGFSMPVHLTADANVMDLCKAEGVACHLFEFPHAIDVRECTPQQAVELIFRLAIAFGVVKCNSALIFGEFRGKGSRRQTLKVVIRNPDLAEQFERELTLCRKLMQLPLGV